jgi:hypothetical protein
MTAGSRQLTCHWPNSDNEHGAPMLWLGSWLVGAHGEEGDWFHSDRGAAISQHAVPQTATGLRVRRWPNEGLEPEYVDLTPVPPDAVLVDELPFERPQSFSMLAAHHTAQPDPA